MDPLLIVFLCVALSAVTVVCITATVVLINSSKHVVRIVASVERSSQTMQEIKQQLGPVLQRSEELFEQLRSTTQNANRQIEKLSKGADAFSAIATDVRSFEAEALDRLRPAMQDVTSLVSGVARGLTTFVRSLMQRA